MMRHYHGTTREDDRLYRANAPGEKAPKPLRRGGRYRSMTQREAALVKTLQPVEMRLHAAIARRQLGRLLGGDEGHALVEETDQWMAGQGIKNPARMAALLAPGFPE